MGVRGLTALLQRLAPDSVKARQITHYSGRTLAVDVSCFLNRFIYGLDPHPARVQRGVHRLSLYLELNGIKPIFVFDMEGRIFEKQRETERRKILKEKVQKSFRLEMKRKKRIGGLKGPAMALKTWTDEQLSEFFENIPANLSETPATAAKPISSPAPSPAPSPVSSPSSSSSSPSSSSPSKSLGEESSSEHVTLREISALEPLEDMSFLHEEEDENVETNWLCEHTDLSDNDFSKLEGISSSPLMDQGHLGTQIITSFVDESSEHDLDIPENLDLDLDSVIDLDLVPYLSLTDDTDSDDGSDPSIWRDIRTGTSIQHLIPAAELARLDFGDPTSPGFDRRVQEKVHAALAQFVKSMESPSGQNILLDENLNQRQKALSELEQKLVKDIKKVYRLKTKERPLEAVTSGISLESDTDVGSSDDTKAKEDVWEEKVSVFENTANSQAGTDAVDNPANEQNEWSEEEDKDTNKGSDAIFATEDLEERADAAKGSTETKKSDRVGDANISSETGSTSETTKQALGDTTQGNELEENRNLRSTLKDIVSAHQSILMTLERRTMRVTRPLVVSCQDLLRAMGQPVIVADDAEAESVCARLVTLGLADGTVSEDTDTAVFGNGILLRQLGSGNNKDILEINPLLAHAGLGLSRDAFRDFCILCGTDFSGKLEGVGPNRAAKLIQSFGSIESVMANSGYKAQHDFVYDHARRVFDRAPIVPNDPQVYQRKGEQEPQLTELLLKYDIDPLQVRMELIKEMETYGSTGLQPTGLGDDPFASDTFGSNPFSITQGHQSETKL